MQAALPLRVHDDIMRALVVQQIHNIAAHLEVTDTAIRIAQEQRATCVKRLRALEAQLANFEDHGNAESQRGV